MARSERSEAVSMDNEAAGNGAQGPDRPESDPEKTGDVDMNKIPDFEYINTRRVSYDGATFIPVCIKCGRYVEADKSIKMTMDGGLIEGEPNATCKKCGRTEMNFEGFFDCI